MKLRKVKRVESGFLHGHKSQVAVSQHLSHVINLTPNIHGFSFKNLDKMQSGNPMEIVGNYRNRLPTLITILYNNSKQPSKQPSPKVFIPNNKT